MLPESGESSFDRSGSFSNDAANYTPELQSQLQQIELVLRKQWRLGQNMVLCWAPDPRGLLTIVVPHYFLGNFTADEQGLAKDNANEAFIRSVIGGSRLKTHGEMFEISKRLNVSTSFIKLEQPLGDDAAILAAAEAVISRYGIGFVETRAVLLFDIAEFSLYGPFEQASQLNSLSYSMNSAYNKLQRQGVEVNFARTTTGDGYYVWNRDIGPYPDLDLLSFLLLVLIDNGVARSQASGHTVPVIRAAYHVGSHYELFQAEGVNPTLLSYIVGDVTIKLARMLANAGAGQVLIGDFQAPLPPMSSPQDGSGFVRAAIAELMDLNNLKISEQALNGIRLLAGSCGTDAAVAETIIDKHGIALRAMNLSFEIKLGDQTLILGTVPQ